MVDFNKGLDVFFHSLIPAKLRKTLDTKSADYIRVRALSAILVILTALVAVNLLMVGGMHLLMNPALLRNDLVVLMIWILLLLQTGFFYKFQNYWMSGIAFTNFYFLVNAVMLIISGGYDSHGKVLILTCPMISFLIGGRQEGIQNTVITILFCLGLAVLKLIDFGLPNVFSAGDPYVIFSVNWATTIVITAICIVVYETEMQTSHRASQNRKPSIFKPVKGLDGFFHSLIPATLRETLSPDSFGYVRVRTLSTMLSLATLMSAVSAVILVSVHLVFHKDQLKYDSVIAGITALFALQAWFFYKFNNFWLSSLVLSYFYFILVLLLVSINGGYDSPMLLLFIISPMVFFMLGGIQQGVQNAVFVILVGLFFAIMKSTGFEFINVFQAASKLMTYSIVSVVAIIAISICIIEYDSQLQKRS